MACSRTDIRCKGSPPAPRSSKRSSVRSRTLGADDEPAPWPPCTCSSHCWLESLPWLNLAGTSPAGQRPWGPATARDRGLGCIHGVARVVGPVVGGVLVLLSGLGVVILFNAASFLVFAAVIMRMPIRRGEIREGQVLARKEGFWAQVSRGVRTPVATVVLAGLVVFYLLVDPVQSQLAAIAARESPNPLMVSLFMSALACGSVIVNPLLRRAQSRGAGPVRILLAGCLGSAVPLPFSERRSKSGSRSCCS